MRKRESCGSPQDGSNRKVLLCKIIHLTSHLGIQKGMLTCGQVERLEVYSEESDSMPLPKRGNVERWWKSTELASQAWRTNGTGVWPASSNQLYKPEGIKSAPASSVVRESTGYFGLLWSRCHNVLEVHGTGPGAQISSGMWQSGGWGPEVASRQVPVTREMPMGRAVSPSIVRAVAG